MRLRNLFPFFFLFAANLAVINFFRESLITNYFQDDWYSISISKTSSLTGVVNFFIPNKQVVYYRPLGMQLPFFLNTLLFGLNPLPFRLLTFFTHAVNSLLVFLLFRRFLKTQVPSILAGFLYVTSAIHYIPFFWSSTYAFVLGMTFSLLTVIFFLDYLRQNKISKLYFSFLFFFLGILTFEIISVLPLILAFYLIFFKLRSKFLSLSPFFAVSFFYLIFRMFFFPPPEIPDYYFAAGIPTLQNLKYYFLWSFNWPEEIRNQFLRFWQVNPKFVSQFWSFYSAFLFTFSVNAILLFILPLILFIAKKIKIDKNLAFFSLIWFLTALLPVIFFPSHAFPYYLPLAFLGLLMFFLPFFYSSVLFLSKRFNFIMFILQSIFMLNWLWSVYVLIEFNSLIHWAPRRGRLSERLIKTAKSKIGSPNQSFFVVVNPHSENRLALNDQDALRIIFQRDSLKTVYTNENVVGFRL